MKRIFITGSADGLGFLAGRVLVEQGHKVVLHARSEERAAEALKKNPGAETALVGELSDIESTVKLAGLVNQLGTFDAVIHNAGVYRASDKDIFSVNTVAPYILTCLIHKPARLIYLSSGMHLQGSVDMDILEGKNPAASYSDSKLHVLMIAKAFARRWPNVYSNAVDPGWVATKMGGKGAPDDLQKGYETQAWLAASDDKDALVSGRYLFHKKEKKHNPLADNTALQDRLLKVCEKISGVPLR